MERHKIIQKTGSRNRENRPKTLGTLLGLGSLLLGLSVVQAAEPIEFQARVDRTEISIDETVSLKMSVKSQSKLGTAEPDYKAPDFQTVNSYSSVSMHSYFDSSAGGFQTQNSQEVTKVLQPMKTGKLKISGIKLNLDGKVYQSPDIIVQVVSGGAPSSSTSNPSSSSGSTPSGAQARKNENQKVGFIQAEMDKKTAFKGEQVIVSYYLYHQSKIFNPQIDKFPVLSGFLREDLEMPILNQRFDSQEVTVNGVPYFKTLLTRYAAYPIQEGELTVDTMAIKFNYYVSPQRNGFDEEDPFFSFFQQLAPRVGSAESSRVSLNVEPLPQSGRPASFTGGVGTFNVSSAVNKYELHANDAVSLIVKVDGHGNLSNIRFPKVEWPAEVELFELKEKDQSSKGGAGFKAFELLLIPRSTGKVRIPPLEFGFFDPESKHYYTKTTEETILNVLDPLPGTTSVPLSIPTSKASPRSEQQASKGASPEMRDLQPPSTDSQRNDRQFIVTYLYWACLGVLILFGSIVGSDLIKKRKLKKGSQNTRETEEARALAKIRAFLNVESGMNQAYELLTGLIFDSIDRACQPMSSRSLPRSELKSVLLGRSLLTPEQWDSLLALLEYADLVRYASGSGAVSQPEARAELPRWIQEAEKIIMALKKS